MNNYPPRMVCGGTLDGMGSKRSSRPAERRAGLFARFRRRFRRRVLAGARRRGPGFPHGWDGWPGDGGAAVREPRRPLPFGPRAGADAAPIPAADVAIDLTDPDTGRP